MMDHVARLLRIRPGCATSMCIILKSLPLFRIHTMSHYPRPLLLVRPHQLTLPLLWSRITPQSAVQADSVYAVRRIELQVSVTVVGVVAGMGGVGGNRTHGL